MYKQTNIENAQEMKALATAIRQVTGSSSTPLSISELQERVESWGNVKYNYLVQNIKNTVSTGPVTVNDFCLLHSGTIKRLMRNIKVQTAYGADSLISIAQAIALVQSITNKGSVTLRTRQSYYYTFQVILDVGDYYNQIMDSNYVRHTLIASNRFEAPAQVDFDVDYSYACHNKTWYDVFASPCYCELNITGIEPHSYTAFPYGPCGQFVFTGNLRIDGFPGETYTFNFGCTDYDYNGITLTVVLGESDHYITVGTYRSDSEYEPMITTDSSFSISWYSDEYPYTSANTWHLVSSGLGSNMALRLIEASYDDYGRRGWTRYFEDPQEGLGDGTGDASQFLKLTDLVLTYAPVPEELGGNSYPGTMTLTGNYRYTTTISDPIYYETHWETLRLIVGQDWPSGYEDITLLGTYHASNLFDQTTNFGPSYTISH